VACIRGTAMDSLNTTDRTTITIAQRNAAFDQSNQWRCSRTRGCSTRDSEAPFVGVYYSTACESKNLAERGRNGQHSECIDTKRGRKTMSPVAFVVAEMAGLFTTMVRIHGDPRLWREDRWFVRNICHGASAPVCADGQILQSRE